MYTALRAFSSEFRTFLAAKYPRLRNNPAYWLMLGYLAFGTFKDEQSSKLVIPAEMVARMERKEQLFRNNNYSAETFLKLFIRDVQPFEYSKWHFTNGKARIITKIEWPQDVAKAIEAERQRQTNRHNLDSSADSVYLEDGLPFSNYKQRQYRERMRQEALAETAKASCEQTRELLFYMNNLPPNLFHKLIRNMPAATEVAKALPDEAIRAHQIDILNAIQDQYQPFYKPTEASARIFPINEGSLLSLKREVRQVLTQDWHEADLKSAQLAICAKLWDVDVVQEFLAAGGNIWQHLFDLFKLPPHPATKDVLKDALYSFLYGACPEAGRQPLKKTLEPLGIPNATKRFLSSPIIRTMKEGQRRQYQQIRENEGAKNCFGSWLPLTKNNGRDRGFNIRSILAQLAQAVELRLLYPVLEFAKQHRGKNGFTITLWQHDGFCFVLGNKGTAFRTHLAIEVANQTDKMGIITELEIK